MSKQSKSIVVDKDTGEVLASASFFRKPFHREKVVTVIQGPSMTHQAHADSCDINNIIRQFDRTGVLPPPRRQPQYGDVTALNKDLTTLINESRDAALEYKKAAVAAKRAKKLAAAEAAKKLEATPSSSVAVPSASPPAGA